MKKKNQKTKALVWGLTGQVESTGELEGTSISGEKKKKNLLRTTRAGCDLALL